MTTSYAELFFDGTDIEDRDKALKYRLFAELSYHSQYFDLDYHDPSTLKPFLLGSILPSLNNPSTNYSSSPYYETSGDFKSGYDESYINTLRDVVSDSGFNYSHKDYGTSTLGANVQVFTQDNGVNGVEIIISINGTDLDITENPGESIKDLLNDAWLVTTGFPPMQVFEVISLIKEIKQQAATDYDGQNVSINLTGHSLGANIVQWIGILDSDLFDTAIAYNPPGVGGVATSLLNWASFGMLQDLVNHGDKIINIHDGNDVALLVGVNYGKTIVLDTASTTGLGDHTLGDFISIIRDVDILNGTNELQYSAYVKQKAITNFIDKVRGEYTPVETDSSENGFKTIKKVYSTSEGHVLTDEFIYQIDTNGDVIEGAKIVVTSTVEENVGSEGGVSLQKIGETHYTVEGDYEVLSVNVIDGHGSQFVTTVSSLSTTGSLSIYNELDEVPFEMLGSQMGSYAANYFSNGEVLHDILVKAFLQTAGQHFGTFSKFLVAGYDFATAFDFANGEYRLQDLDNYPEFKESLLKNATNLMVSSAADAISDEVRDLIGVGGVGGEIIEVTTDTVSTAIFNETIDIVFNQLDSSLFSNIADGKFFQQPALDADGHVIYELNGETVPAGTEGAEIKFESVDVQSLIANAVASYVGSRLAGEVLEPESETAALFGSIGSGFATYAVGVSATAAAAGATSTTTMAALGNLLSFGVAGPVGIAIGAFIGALAGTSLGNVIGGEASTPSATAKVFYDAHDAEYELGASREYAGGDKTIAESMAQQVINGVNNIIESTHGALRLGAQANALHIGYDGSEYTVSFGDGASKSFENTADAIMFATFKTLKSFDLVGGHAVVMRAWHNSEATNFTEFKEDIEVAEAFQNYLADPTSILALMMNDPTSDLAQSWAAVLERAAELELHLPHEKDLDGGWGEILLAQGVDPASIPSLDGDTLTITDPVTGEETVLHHIIGPGYEIVRIEGTDGNDIIEVIVDGPSISYVAAGDGDDIIEGSDQADIIYGGGGEDEINGNDGNDWIHGGEGSDNVDGGAGEDLIVGGSEDDYLFGGDDTDIIYGNDGADTLFGMDGQDYLHGGDGDDHLYAYEGSSDHLYGDKGNDTYHSYGGSVMYASEGDDTFILHSSNTGVNSNIHVSRLSGHYTIIAEAGHEKTHIQFANGIGGNELFFQQVGDDLKILVLGEDLSVTVQDYFTTSIDIQVHIRDNEFKATGQGYSAATIAYLVGVDSALSEVPSGQYNVLSDTALAQRSYTWANVWTKVNIDSPDVDHGTNASDAYITPSAGHKNMYGWAGDDEIRSYDTTTYINDHLYGDSGNDTLVGGKGIDLLSGGLGDDHLNGGLDDDSLWGGHGDDSLIGSDGNDILFGGAGDDRLKGGEGDDELNGEDGNDILTDNIGNNILRGGEGDDFLGSYNSTGDNALYGDEGSDEILLGSGNDLAYGGTGDDTISAADGENWIYGEDGSDTLTGGLGDDHVSGGDGDDIITDYDGANVLNGGLGNDAYYALSNNANNIIYDLGGTDYLHAQSGVTLDDILFYKEGADLRISLDQGQAIVKDHFLSSGDYMIESLLFSDGDSIDLSEQGFFGNNTPIAANDDFVVNEDEQLSGNVLLDNGSGEDLDLEGDLLRVRAETITTLNNVLIIMMIDGSFNYTAAQNFYGTDSFEYTLYDTHGFATTAEATITILPVNDAPEAVDDVFDTDMNASLSGNVLNNNGYGVDDDIDGDTLGVVAEIITTSNGSVTISANGDFVYNPNADFYGADSFVYTLTDGQGGTASATATIDVERVTIAGTSSDDTLQGTSGDDFIKGGDGDDLLYGYSGDDTYLYDAGDGFDTIYEAGGYDKVVFDEEMRLDNFDIDYVIGTQNMQITSYETATDVVLLTDNTKNDQSYRIEELVFEDAGSVIISATHWAHTTNAMTVTGSSSTDVMYGLGGNDSLIGRDGNDILFGNDGNDYLYGQGDNDILFGNYGNDVLYGDTSSGSGTGGNDRLYGGYGDDSLIGGIGDDHLSGQFGADNLNGGDGADTFFFAKTSAFDAVDTIADFDTTEGDAIDISDVLFGYDPLTDAIEDFVQITDNGTDSTVYVDADGGGDNFVAIATLSGVTGMTDEAQLETNGNLITSI